MNRLTDWLVFQLERLLLRGAPVRLLFMAASVLLVAVLGGLALVAIGAPEGVADAIWWAFLRLTDPGYLGDDEGLARRTLSTVLTVLGYVLFMGALIAILTQWLHATVAWLQRGETPLILRGHLVVLGLTPRTPVIVQELLRSEARVRRLLSLGRRRLTVVILVEDLDEDLRAELASQLGKAWNDRQVILRSGSPLIESHLRRVDLAHAAAVLVPGAHNVEASPAEQDALTIKTVLSVAHHPSLALSDAPPRIVAEIADERLLGVVREAYPGSLVLLPTQQLASQLIAQNLRHRGLSWVLGELLAYRTGNDLFFVSFTEAVGRPMGEVTLAIGGGLCLGLVRADGTPVLVPPDDLRVQDGDRFVVIASSFEALCWEGPVEPMPSRPPPPGMETALPEVRRVLALGWSDRARLMLLELDTYAGESVEVDVVSVRSAEEREAELAGSGRALERVQVRHLVGDYVDLHDVRAQDLRSYDNVVIFARDWLQEGADSDAQTILGSLLVRAELAEITPRPSVLVELTDPNNARLFEDRPGEVLLSPEVMGRVMAHVAVRPEVPAVLGELFSAGGAEMHYRDASDYELLGQTVSFGDLRREAQARGEIALGVRISETPIDVRGDLSLAPADDEVFTLDAHALMLVLTRNHRSEESPA